ncbi:hypothetical protein DXU06_43300 [Bradyrhizobium elkanii]|jgi:hypothetical protein|nr:hypothetical protein XI02_10875 [Bradyrhizobium sp. CCBAU 21365]
MCVCRATKGIGAIETNSDIALTAIENVKIVHRGANRAHIAYLLEKLLSEASQTIQTTASEERTKRHVFENIL